jgi:TPP-dependent pyruvate/acetoin dehydrogenase alpha subunit
VVNDLLNTCLDYYYQMLKIRRFEEALNDLYAQGYINGTLHLCVGQEAVAVGVCGALNIDDYITSTHRGHGHFIAKGGDITRMMAELFGLREGYCGGAGGTQHMADFSIGHLGSNGITGGQIPVATGAALALKLAEKKQVVACFFGDGAANEGLFHESLNMASIWNLPIIYICENNLYAMSTPFQKAFNIHDIAIRSVAYGMRGRVVDGMDVLEVKNEAAEAVEAARNGKGPTLIECKTYRFSGHSKSDPRIYRTRQEEALWQEKDPINLLKKKLYGNGALELELETIENRVKTEIENAIVHCQDMAKATTASR